MPVSDAQVLIAAICECDWDGRTFAVLGAADKKRYLDRSRAALEAASLPQGAPEWQPIETAPKDGTWLWLYVPGHGPARARWKARMGWESHTNGREITKGTHWMPLPASPDPEGL